MDIDGGAVGTDAMLPSDGAVPPDGAPLPDAVTAIDIPHVTPADEFGGTVDWFVEEDELVVVNTSGLRFQPEGTLPPNGIEVLSAAHDPAQGPEIAIIRVRNLFIEDGAGIFAFGQRPLVIIADGEVTVNGILSVGAFGDLRGAGGSLPFMGLGVGGDGNHQGFRDGGGGGGGHATVGGSGGTASSGIGTNAFGGEAGSVYGDAPITFLRGGSGGGEDGACSFSPGAGGGALHLYSAARITIGSSGAVTAGGGGGGAGALCELGGNSIIGGGAGGGSGGALFIQAPQVFNNGAIGANGGGGGGGSNASTGGEAGEDGFVTSAALGGTAPMSGASAGGNGAFGNTAAEAGMDENGGNGNAGGGGGGVGRVVIHTHPGGLSQLGEVSPSPLTSTY